MYDDFLAADQRYQAARQTNESDHGWAFDPEPEPKPNAWSFLIPAFAVCMVLVGMAACLAAEVTL